jgi:hypothetical protein
MPKIGNYGVEHMSIGDEGSDFTLQDIDHVESEDSAKLEYSAQIRDSAETEDLAKIEDSAGTDGSGEMEYDNEFPASCFSGQCNASTLPLESWMHICGFQGCTHHYASLSQSTRSIVWNKEHADACYEAQHTTQWTDNPRADVVEHFRAPPDDGDTSIDVLRYKFAGETGLPLPKGTHGNAPKKTHKDHLHQWSLALHHLSLPTPDDSQDSVVANVGCQKNGVGVKTLSQI